MFSCSIELVLLGGAQNIFTRDLMVFRRRLGALVDSDVAPENIQDICIGKDSRDLGNGKLKKYC
jgi:hypothetical protein